MIMYSTCIKQLRTIRRNSQSHMHSLAFPIISKYSFSTSKDRPMTSLELLHLKRTGKKIAMITAYDYPSGRHAEMANFEIVLVGDSLGMVVLGYSTTQPVTMEDIIHHCKAVRRGAPTRFIVADLPFGSYESGEAEALKNSFRLVKEAGADAVKLEGGKIRASTVRKIVDSGIAVMGHVGLTPQGVSVLGGFRAQGRTAVKAKAIVDDAMALQEAGAFGIVIECVPEQVAKAVSESVRVPVIGIGAGPHTDGQVLVYHDVLGILHHPHYEKHVPSFCKRYSTLGSDIHIALSQYRAEVHEGLFPSSQYSPYKMPEEEKKKFEEMLLSDMVVREDVSKKVEKRLKDADEYETVNLY